VSRGGSGPSAAARSGTLRRTGPVRPGTLAYLALLLAAVGPNAELIVDDPAAVVSVGTAALVLNAVGYLIAAGTRPLFRGRAERVAMLFTVSKKGVSIAALVVSSSGLAPEVALPEVALPAMAYAAVQMLTSPLVARTLARRA
jgi:bile acid:Na+ symporter, BASS family